MALPVFVCINVKCDADYVPVGEHSHSIIQQQILAIARGYSIGRLCCFKKLSLSQ